MATQTTTNKGFIKDAWGNKLLPITRAELVLDQHGIIAFNSTDFLAENGHPGLVTAEERAMLTGNAGTGGGITDIYNKLGYINEGLQVNDTTIPFYVYDTEKLKDVATPINLIGKEGEIVISVGEKNTVDEKNTVSISLDPLYTDKEGNLAPSVLNSILRGITVDNFGRIIAVQNGTLTSTDIPEELTNKKLKGCTAESVDSNNTNAIVNVGYVEAKLNEITGVATGALRFGGTLPSDDTISKTTWNNQTSESNTIKTFCKDHNYHYYKATLDFDIDGQFNVDGTTLNVKVGDTLIITEITTENSTNSLFVHVPSGDDITAITVSGKDASGNNINAIDEKVGQVALEFDELFTLSGKTDNDVNIATIKLKQVSIESDGYLSQEDYIAFKSLKGVSYELKNTILSYEIGTITIGDTATTIHGKDTTYSMGLTASKDALQQLIKSNPTLHFEGSDKSSTDITYEGVNGINIETNDTLNKITFSPNFEITNSNGDTNTLYLSFEDGQFTVNVGSETTDSETNAVTYSGITPYNEFRTVAHAALYSTGTISNSLNKKNWKEGETYTYYYGSDALKIAIAATI